MAKIYFSIGGKHYVDPPVVFEFMIDNAIEVARDVTIPLEQRVGQFVKIELFFAERWIMISEIRFENGELL